METPWPEVVEKTHLGVWILDPDDRTIYANDRLASLLGLPPGEMLHRTPPELIDSHQSLRLLTCLRQNQPLLTDFCLRRRDGKHLFLLLAANPWYSTAVGGRGTLLMVADITERKLVEELLWRQAHIVDQISDAVISADLNGCITSWNQSAERLFGHAATEVLGKPLTLLRPMDQAKIFSNEVMAVLSQKGLYELEVQLRHRTGKAFYAHFSLSPLKDRERQLIGVIASVRDITARKNLENELIRTGKLESIGILASGIAHDFNNLLTAILGNITMAGLNAGGSDIVRERLAEAEKACVRAQNLASQLLTFTKREKPQKRLISLGNLLRTSASLLLRSSNVSRSATIPPDLWWVEADEEQLHQAINHLLINADQAMPSGGAVHIRAENVHVADELHIPLKPGRYVRVSVQDQGIGIPPEHLNKVFDPFFTTKKRGSGLGLSTVYYIIKNHEGHITVESTRQGGAMFIIYLPACRQKGHLTRAKRLKLSFGKGKVLLMDDEEMIREVSSAMLHKLGYDVTVAQDGAEALALYRRAVTTGEPFAAVILDLTVPGGRGAQETIADLQALDPHVKVIVSSGFADDPLLTDFQQYGFSGFMPKPYNITQLSAMLHKILH